MSEAIKFPKKFRDICDLIRNDDTLIGIEKLRSYPDLEHQKTAVFAEIAYFDGDFENALSYDMKTAPFWNEWHYSNVGEEHVAAMAFAARCHNVSEQVKRFFAKQQKSIEQDADSPEHIRRMLSSRYSNWSSFIDTGEMPWQTQPYVPPADPLSADEIIASNVQAFAKLEPESTEWNVKLFEKICIKGRTEDMLSLYENVADNNLSTMWHLYALGGYRLCNEDAKGFDVVLRMARQRLWYIAAPTQVRPMEFFTHRLIHPYLKESDSLRAIRDAAALAS